MTLLSSTLTRFYKRTFPALFFGLAIFVPAVFAIVQLLSGRSLSFPLLAGPLAFGGLGFFILRYLVRDFADEVYESGETLVVHRDGRVTEIPIAQIESALYSAAHPSTHVKLRLRAPSVELGRSFSFIAPPGQSRFEPEERVAALLRKVEGVPADGRPSVR